MVYVITTQLLCNVGWWLHCLGRILSPGSGQSLKQSESTDFQQAYSMKSIIISQDAGRLPTNFYKFKSVFQLSEIGLVSRL